jgi:hypothetical protein
MPLGFRLQMIERQVVSMVRSHVNAGKRAVVLQRELNSDKSLTAGTTRSSLYEGTEL